jgi:hypothetical protein
MRKETPCYQHIFSPDRSSQEETLISRHYTIHIATRIMQDIGEFTCKLF